MLHEQLNNARPIRVSDEIHQISVNLVIALADIAYSVNWPTATATKI
jgi:hypothetical protein